MKFFLIIGTLCCLVLSSCGDLGLFTTKNQSGGIHRIGKTRPSGQSTLASFTQAKSVDGFLPASASETMVARASALKKDKHGMPTYSLAQRQRYVRTTAYSHQENEPGAPWKKNAIGTFLKYGQVRSAAADWSKYPVGTKFKIKGLPHTYVIDDYGSALVGTNTVDIYHPTLRSMNRWGTRKTEISVIQWGDWERTLKILGGRKKYPHTRKMYYAAKAKVDAGLTKKLASHAQHSRKPYPQQF